MQGMESYEVSKLRREEMAREVRTNRISGAKHRKSVMDAMRASMPFQEARRDFGRLLRPLRAFSKTFGRAAWARRTG